MRHRRPPAQPPPSQSRSLDDPRPMSAGQTVTVGSLIEKSTAAATDDRSKRDAAIAANAEAVASAAARAESDRKLAAALGRTGPVHRAESDGMAIYSPVGSAPGYVREVLPAADEVTVPDDGLPDDEPADDEPPADDGLGPIDDMQRETIGDAPGRSPSVQVDPSHDPGGHRDAP